MVGGGEDVLRSRRLPRRHGWLSWEDPHRRLLDGLRDLTAAVIGQRPPQIIVDGMWQEVGSNRQEIETLISTAASVERERLDVELTLAGANRVRVRITGSFEAGADVTLLRLDANRPTAIEGGENRGRKIVYVNVVRDFRTVARWRGSPIDVTLDLAPGGDSCAVIVQEAGPGPILGAAWVATPDAD